MCIPFMVEMGYEKRWSAGLIAVAGGLGVIGDGSGITHSLSHASASGVFVARDILAQNAG